MPALVVLRSRGRALIGLGVALAFGVYSVVVGLWIGLVVFAIVAAAIGVSLIRNRPALVVDSDGIRTPTRSATWTDVADVRVTRNRMAPAPLLTVQLTTGRPIRILLRDLDTPTPEILQAIDGYRR